MRKKKKKASKSKINNQFKYNNKVCWREEEKKDTFFLSDFL
jgi:hypothetical protein